MVFDGKTVLITGGTGSFGTKLIETLLERHDPKAIRVFSRDELKQSELRRRSSDDDDRLRYLIGDVRDLPRLTRAMRGVDVVVHAAALKQVEERPVLVVNSDVPAVTPRDLLALLGAMPAQGMALVEARDGTTNALALSAPHLFSSLYGPDSVRRFRRHAERLGIELVAADIPHLVADVDTPQDLARLDGSLGPRTQAALSAPAAVTP